MVIQDKFLNGNPEKARARPQNRGTAFEITVKGQWVPAEPRIRVLDPNGRFGKTVIPQTQNKHSTFLNNSLWLYIRIETKKNSKEDYRREVAFKPA